MANVYAVKTGNWSDTTVWNTGALPTSADDVYANTFTVTINQSITVVSLRNGAATGITAGGSFSITAGGFTITANIIATGATTCVSWSAPIGTLTTITGNLTGGSASNAVNCTGAGNMNITGDLTSSSQTANGLAIGSGANGIFNITGTVNGTTVTGTGASGGLYIGGTSACTVNLTGTVNAGKSPGVSIVTGSACTFNHVGAAYASADSPAIVSTSVSHACILSGPLVASDGTGGNASGAGVAAVLLYRWFPADNALTTFSMVMRGATVSGSPLARPARTLYLTNAYASSYPAAGNVRSGTTYGAGNSLTGTCAVPPAGSVIYGVPVDNTTGTAAVDVVGISSALAAASAITLNQQTSTLTTSGSIGERFRLVSTVATTAQQLSDALSNE